VEEVTQSRVQWVHRELVILVHHPAQEVFAAAAFEVVEAVVSEVGLVTGEASVIEAEVEAIEVTEVVSEVDMEEEVLVIKTVTVLELLMVHHLAPEAPEVSTEVVTEAVEGMKTVIEVAEVAAIVNQLAKEMEVETTGTEIGMVGMEETSTGKDLMMETIMRINDKRGATKLTSRLSLPLFSPSNHHPVINCFSCVTILLSFLS
jgi:hypothetical protein